jgi:predicted transcriptional regulator
MLTITLPDEMYLQLKEMAEKKGQSAAALIRLALSEFYEKEKVQK